MGDFSFIPQFGETYYAVCFNDEGVKKTFQLPKALSSGLSLRIDAEPDVFRISLMGMVAENMQLIILQRGFPIYAESWRGNSIDFPIASFREGILRFVLLNQGRIVSERQVFVFSDKNAITCQISDIVISESNNASLTQLNLTLRDGDGNPIEGIASVSVTRNGDFLPDSLQTIQSELLLSSDLQKTTNNLGWYFGNAPAKKRHEAMDLLMRVRGWRRYEIEPVLQGNYRKPGVMPEASMQITGKVTNRRGQGIANCNVSLGAPGAGILEHTTSLSDGSFVFAGFEAPENTHYLITATTEKGKENVYVVLDKDSAWFHQIPLFTNRPKSTCSVFSQRGHWLGYRNKALEKITMEEGIRHIYLQELEVSAPKKKEYVSEFEKFANKTITEEHIKQSGTQNLRMALSVLIGFRWPSREKVDGGLWVPMLVFDDMPVYDYETREYLLEKLPVEDVGQIDVIKGIQAIGFFNGKQNMIVAVSTKRGRGIGTYYEKTNKSHITPFGYQQPVEVYAPKYKPLQSNMPDLRSVLLWQPALEIKSGKGKADFYIARSNLPVSVVAEGVTVDGNTFRIHKEIAY